MTELKHCPFCGTSSAMLYIMEIMRNHNSMEYQIECDYCGAASPIVSTEAQAIEAWNRRADENNSIAQKALEAGQRGEEVRFHINGRLFAVRELAQ